MIPSTRSFVVTIAFSLCIAAWLSLPGLNGVQQSVEATPVVSADFIEPINADIRQARILIEQSQFFEAQSLLESLTESVSEIAKGQAICSLAEVAIRRSELPKADFLIDSCQDEISKISSYATLRAYLYHLKGFRSHSSGDYTDAIKNYEISLQTSVAAAGPMSSPFLNTLNNLGNVYYRMGEYSNAESIHSEVLAGRISSLGESHPKVAASLGNLGNVYEAAGKPEKAYRNHKHALEIWHHHFGKQHIQLSYSLNNAGLSLLNLGRYSEAQELLSESISIKRDLLGEHSPKTISSLINLANVYLELNDLNKANESVLRAIEIATLHNLQDLPSYSSSVNTLARIEIQRDQLTEALERVDSEINRIGWSANVESIDLQHTRSSICISISDFQCALESAQFAIDLNTGIVGSGNRESLSLLRSASSRDRLVSSLFLKAQALIGLAEGADARSFRLRAFETFDVALSFAQSEIISSSSTEYSTASSEFIRSHLDQFLRTGLMLFEETDDPYLASRMFAVIDVLKGGLLLANMRDRLPSKSHPGVKRRTINGSASHLFAQYDTITPNELQANNSVIAFFEIGSDLFAVVVNDSGYAFQQIGNAASIAETSQVYRKSLASKNFREVRKISHELYQQLLFPLEEHFLNDHLVIIPSITVKGLPFETLLTKELLPNDQLDPPAKEPFLIHRNGVSYAFSASLLEVQGEFGHTEYERELLALAPVFDHSNDYSPELKNFLRTVSRGNPINHLVSLPGSAAEVLDIAETLKQRDTSEKQYSPENNLVLLRHNSSESALKSMDLTQNRIIHIATHSFLNPQKPDSSGIILETNGRNGEDGILFAREILDLNINAELVVLSSCDTAVENEDSPLELSGFATGFIYAGAQHLIASMWPADDVGTQILMQRLYSHISSGRSPDEALTLAKSDLISMGGPIANPYFWAGFIHIGAPRDLVKEAA